MIRVELSNLLFKLNTERKEIGEKVRLKYEDIHILTGIHKKILSRIVNKPDENTSSEHIDRLCQFFFLEFRRIRKETQTDEQLMKEVVSNLIDVFPDEDLFLAGLENSTSKPLRTIPITVLWWMYQHTDNRQKTIEWWEEHRKSVLQKSDEEKARDPRGKVWNSTKPFNTQSPPEPAKKK